MSDRQLRVGLVTEPEGIDDPYNHGAYLGLERAVRELGIRGRVLTPAPKEGYVPSPLTSRAAEVRPRHRNGNLCAPPRSTESPPDFPKRGSRSSTSPTTDLAHRPKNVLGLAFSAEQAGYLAGHLAALVLTLSPGEEVISSVGGERVPLVERWIAGYQAGARGANPRVTTLNSYTDDFLDPVKGRSVALSQIAKGSRVVFQVANACGLGALEAASERGIWGIGVDVDQSHLGRHILTSAVIEDGRGGVRHDRGARARDARDRSYFPLLPPERRCRPRHDQRGVCPARSRPRSRTSGPRSSPGRSRSRATCGHIALSLWIETQTVPSQEATSVGAWPTGTRPTTRPSCGIDLDDGAVGVVGREHRSIRRAQAHEPSADRGRLSHRSRVRVDAPDLASRVRDPDSLLPGRQRDGVPDGHLGRGCVRVRLDAQGPLGGRHHPECLLAECHAYRYMADVDDRGRARSSLGSMRSTW